ncbi:GNAT family N-acetyltransferase [Virgibacillus soli]|uniref:GNAT family N-acetyltransferase n=1 Tax=Paracerasibacillus soli TaxID=480284 RepID=A0ABU5CMB3_9BACI|nr:GNAT family N-acetyltransferase [Virgibacillus soli]MDY0407503.1 GNAT family N-acetyltransferase [Virgibacillus soli]
MHTIKRGHDKFFIGETEENPIAEITFIKEGNTLIVNHTYVSNDLRGQGVAAKLVEHVINYAKNENKKIIPTCSYVATYFKRHPQASDVLAAK